MMTRKKKKKKHDKAQLAFHVKQDEKRKRNHVIASFRLLSTCTMMDWEANIKTLSQFHNEHIDQIV